MENLTYSNYQQFKQVLDTVINRTVEDFVMIGYLLDKAATTDILLESGYVNVNEMAWKEYKLDDSQTSRFINIYREFGVEGQPRLQDKYKEHGVAKLGLMLTMPEYIRDEITAEYSKREINQIKKIVEEEKKITDIEVLCEEKDSLQQLLPNDFKKLVMQFAKDYPETYVRIYDAITFDDLKEIMAPNGESVFKVRVPGVGLHLFFAKANENIVVTNTRTGEKEYYEWEQLFEALKEYFAMGGDAKESWSNVFQEPFPEEQKQEAVKESEITAKSEKNKVKQAKPKKESKVKVPAPKPKKLSKTESKEEPVKELEEQLPGQDSILNHPEYLPDSMKEEKPEVLTGEVVDCDNAAQEENGVKNPEEPQSDNVQQSYDGMKVEYIAPVQDAGEEHIVSSLKKVLKASVETLGVMVEKEDWSMVISKATDIVHRAKKIQELEEKK